MGEDEPFVLATYLSRSLRRACSLLSLHSTPHGQPRPDARETRPRHLSFLANRRTKSAQPGGSGHDPGPSPPLPAGTRSAGCVDLLGDNMIAMTTPRDVREAQLAEACSRWQSGRDGGSSRLRGAARALTGIPHYFQADFISSYERAARADPEAMLQAATLLRAVAAAEPLDADGWSGRAGLPARGFAGRGLQENPKGEPEILRAMESGTITMPLWGLSLDPAVAASYGTRFRFELKGIFPAIAAWSHSNEKHHEQEIIAGGAYRVLGTVQDGATTVVHLRYRRPVGADVGTDVVLLGVLARLQTASMNGPGQSPEVVRSEVRRTPSGDALTVTLHDARVIELLAVDPRADFTLTLNGGERVSLRVGRDPDEIVRRIADLIG